MPASISSRRQPVGLTNTLGTVDGFTAPFFVNGDANSAVLLVDDGGDTTGDTGALTGSTLNGVFGAAARSLTPRSDAHHPLGQGADAERRQRGE